MVASKELLWFGKRPTARQLGDSDELRSATVRERQSLAYTQVESMVELMESILNEPAT